MAGLVLAGGRLFAADSNLASPVLTTPAIYVPDTSHQHNPLPDGVLAWDNIINETNAAADDASVQFVFSFTNVSPDKVALLDVHPSCGCTTAQLPPMPWIVAPGTNGQFGLTVNILGKVGTLFKNVTVTTDKGSKQLILKINILPPVVPTLSDADRARGLAMAKADRQSIFRDECATCHVKPGQGRYGKPLYDAVCGICHDSEHRASMVPDLRTVKTPSNVDFWQTWIAHGKPGSLMPAFSTTDGGPLTDMQIASVAAYLAAIIPRQAPVNK